MKARGAEHAAWSLLHAVHLVLAGVTIGMLDTVHLQNTDTDPRVVDGETFAGDLDFCELVLLEDASALGPRHQSIVALIRDGVTQVREGGDQHIQGVHRLLDAHQQLETIVEIQLPLALPTELTGSTENGNP